ncbi:DUF4433 domain-containing protein [Neisseria sicca]|jgi:hypothetical protein|uniref:DUF4433 domain-containing protein n=1 Tax=Neisseria sicca TaxID=490 RepID=A0A2I1XAK8_NEISI|nr:MULTISPECIES: DarT ssDNA thymidine ADP-ribosyltransferase family protein [Neisseria]PLA39678.1 DUF4433 domain-containing protein [Neisseria sicca]RDF01552.1 DUF4433 domain-containing protein [Aggregatibacter aphrophilus]
MSIENILRERQIQYLCHFTRLENLESILTHGLIPRSDLYNPEFNPNRNLRVSGLFNDTVRADEKINAICLSIAFPNSKMFYKLRREQENSQWVVIVLHSSLLLSKNCAFYPTNAANNNVRHSDISNFQGERAFNILFDDIGDERQFLLPKDPTDVQAEVLVFDNIETNYIACCVFNSNDLRDNFLARYTNYQFYSLQNQWGLFDDRLRARQHNFIGC